MIETQQAVNDIESILDVPGIDAIYVGPGDLAFSYGRKPKLDHDDPEMLGHLRQAAEGVRQARHLCRHPLRPRRLRGARHQDGFRLTTIANDSGLMAMAARKAVADVWQEVGNLK